MMQFINYYIVIYKRYISNKPKENLYSLKIGPILTVTAFVKKDRNPIPTISVAVMFKPLFLLKKQKKPILIGIPTCNTCGDPNVNPSPVKRLMYKFCVGLNVYPSKERDIKKKEGTRIWLSVTYAGPAANPASSI